MIGVRSYLAGLRLRLHKRKSPSSRFDAGQTSSVIACRASHRLVRKQNIRQFRRHRRLDAECLCRWKHGWADIRPRLTLAGPPRQQTANASFAGWPAAGGSRRYAAAVDGAEKTSFDPDDLLTLAKIADDAHTFIHQNRSKEATERE